MDFGQSRRSGNVETRSADQGIEDLIKNLDRMISENSTQRQRKRDLVPAWWEGLEGILKMSGSSQNDSSQRITPEQLKAFEAVFGNVQGGQNSSLSSQIMRAPLQPGTMSGQDRQRLNPLPMQPPVGQPLPTGTKQFQGSSVGQFPPNLSPQMQEILMRLLAK